MNKAYKGTLNLENKIAVFLFLKKTKTNSIYLLYTV